MKHYLTLNDLPSIETAIQEAMALKSDPYKYKYLGTQKTIFIGGITMMLGHFLMVFPDLLFLAMGLLIIGNVKV